MEHSSNAFVDENIFVGFLEMETKPNSGVFHRRFMRLNPSANTLEYFVDRQQVFLQLTCTLQILESYTYYEGCGAPTISCIRHHFVA